MNKIVSCFLIDECIVLGKETYVMLFPSKNVEVSCDSGDAPNQYI